MFIDKAEKNGAIAIVYEAASEAISNLSSDVASVHVTDSRVAEAVIANILFNRPAEKLRMSGITGTNGKTSTTYLTRNL
jgi:UDP-N-acetylmuramoyl-L-alanyl-D-glutamate--2,6-diaminopimelate ligase